MNLDYESIWTHVVNAPNHRGPYSLHGPDHWLRVERNACILASRTGALIHVVRLFSLFHDSRRVNECTDPGHGARGAEFAGELRGQLFDIPDEDFELLKFACQMHTEGHHHDDPTIGTCWDADRLDIGRVGVVPNSAFMSTAFATEIADYGTTKPWMDLASQFIEDPVTHHLRYR